MKSQLFNILRDAANDAFAVSKVVLGDLIDNSLNGFAAYAFRDSSGNATMPQLNTEGALVVTNDSGTPINPNAYTQASGAQTKNVETLVGEYTIDLNKKYNCFKAYCQSTRLFYWRLAYIDDADVTPVESTIGYGLSGAGVLNAYVDGLKRIIDTSGGTGTQKIALYATPLDQVDDISANIGFNEIL